MFRLKLKSYPSDFEQCLTAQVPKFLSTLIKNLGTLTGQKLARRNRSNLAISGRQYSSSVKALRKSRKKKSLRSCKIPFEKNVPGADNSGLPAGNTY
ncbi:hypothetical protein K0M31_011959 [Melipona bicolor]|uniref:Uncharacterized protein n=1 Tax=Melipona bicolor TaxID=60889 RepID=A0AA40GAJ0_9HYME|nr:hypothetical protein K0M31_011959 [Melipona bicolor]